MTEQLTPDQLRFLIQFTHPAKNAAGTTGTQPRTSARCSTPAACCMNGWWTSSPPTPTAPPRLLAYPVRRRDRSAPVCARQHRRRPGR